MGTLSHFRNSCRPAEAWTSLDLAHGQIHGTGTGPFQKSLEVKTPCGMSALPPKADIGTQSRNVCFVPKADISLERLKLIHSFCRTHELECLDNLFAVRMLVNLARGPIGEFVRVVCWNRIAGHQRVNDPDCTWLHCLPHPDRPSETAPIAHTVPIFAESQREHTRLRDGVHRNSAFAQAMDHCRRCRLC